MYMDLVDYFEPMGHKQKRCTACRLQHSIASVRLSRTLFFSATTPGNIQDGGYPIGLVSG